MKSTAIAAIAALIACTGITNSASAGGGHHHRHHFFNHGPSFGIVIGSGYRNDCSFYREMWEDTGSFKWKRRYYTCRGWW